MNVPIMMLVAATLYFVVNELSEAIERWKQQAKERRR